MVDPAAQRRMLQHMSECAYRLGVAFGEAAERAPMGPERLEYFQLFDRCFFAVRVATTLELRLLRTPWPSAALAAAGQENEAAERAEREADGDDRDRWGEADRDREREGEAASLPTLLRTLRGVAADAARLPGPEPADLPTLRELLAEAGARPAPARDLPARDLPAARSRAAPAHAAATASRPAAGLRARLVGSATAAAIAAAPPAPAGPFAGLAVRRATGPPPRR